MPSPSLECKFDEGSDFGSFSIVFLGTKSAGNQIASKEIFVDARGQQSVQQFNRSGWFVDSTVSAKVFREMDIIAVCPDPRFYSQVSSHHSATRAPAAPRLLYFLQRVHRVLSAWGLQPQVLPPLRCLLLSALLFLISIRSPGISSNLSSSVEFSLTF